MSTKAFAPDTMVWWRPGFRPVAFPHEMGRVFTSSASVTFVVWSGGDAKPLPVATRALTRVGH